ncbi:MAG: hypothetical protein AW07_04078 [Candidatus Accumulibacter sp. SK-11]|nr:MAG: hypothetical protein AW07_04078 [Candidatus Accumulibacter sp. SK-11]
MVSARVQLTTPAIKPLLLAMNRASDADTLRVRLLSIAQHPQANAIASGPSQLSPSDSPSGQDKITPPATMATIPKTMRRSALSLNTNQAISAVNTASRFSSSDAVDPLVRVSPNMRATGPNMPPKKIAPNSQGHS